VTVVVQTVTPSGNKPNAAAGTSGSSVSPELQSLAAKSVANTLFAITLIVSSILIGAFWVV
jgi:hypothetical protein